MRRPVPLPAISDGHPFLQGVFYIAQNSWLPFADGWRAPRLCPGALDGPGESRPGAALPVQYWTCTVLDMDTAETEALLTGWKRRIDSDNAERDGLIRAAREADVSIHRISQLSGVSRTTIYKILDLDRQLPSARSQAYDEDHITE